MANLDLDRLLDFCIRFAQNRLLKSGAFYPFAANVQADGTVTPLAIHTGNEHPEARQMIEQLTTLLTTIAREKGIRAAAVCYDGLIAAGGEEQKDAITVGVEHHNGECATVYLPYTLESGGGYTYDPLIAIQSEPRIFVQSRQIND